MTTPKRDKKPKLLEKDVQKSILFALGKLPNILIFRNSVGIMSALRSDGKSQLLKVGLGKGSPDLIGCILLSNGIGQFFGLEVKRPGGKLRPDQVKCHEIWKQYGIMVDTVTSSEEALSAIETFTQRCNLKCNIKCRTEGLLF